MGARGSLGCLAGILWNMGGSAKANPRTVDGRTPQFKLASATNR